MNVNDIGLCQRVQAAPTPVAAKRLGQEIPGGSDNIPFNFDLMAEILEEKAKQCRSYRDELRRCTGPGFRILHSTYARVDVFWTTGLDFRDVAAHYGWFPGLNALGRQLEHVRDALLEEDSYDASLQIVEQSGCVYFGYDGEDIGPSPSRGHNPLPRRQLPRCYNCQTPGHFARDCHRTRFVQRRPYRLTMDGRRIIDPWNRHFYRNPPEQDSGRTFYSQTMNRSRMNMAARAPTGQAMNNAAAPTTDNGQPVIVLDGAGAGDAHSSAMDTDRHVSN